MNRLVISMSVAALALGLYLSSGLLQQAKQAKDQGRLVVKTTEDLELSIRNLESIKDNPVIFIEEYYRSLSEVLRIFGAFHDFKIMVEVVDLNETGTIRSAIKHSVWEGIKEMTLKVDFYDVIGEDRYLSIFQSLREIEKRCPVDIIAIDQNGKNLRLMIQLYGK
jgi:hypothetical protein